MKPQMTRSLLLGMTAGLAASLVGAQAQTGRSGQVPPRDQPAQRAAPTVQARGRVAGRVLTADTGQPVRRARVQINAAELPGGRAVLTGDDGTYEFTELPAGRYTLNVSKASFITISYGQRRPLQPGTPLQLGADQQLTNVDFRLPKGSVIAGYIADETGNPLPNTTVQVLAYRYAQGARQLVPAGAAQTDDRGAYRVWGLNPGEYYLSAMARDFGGRGLQVLAAAAGRAGRGGRAGGAGPGRGPLADLAPADTPDEAVRYAPTFYPGVTTESDARPVSVGLSTELLDVNFSVRLVPAVTVSGQVSTPGGPATGGNVVLIPASGGGRRGMGANNGARVRNDGSFTFTDIAPGRYVLRMRGGPNEAPLFANQPVIVGESDVRDLAVLLAPGATITGTVAFVGSGSVAVPDSRQIRIGTQPLDPTEIGPNRPARVERDGTFVMDGVPPGPHWIRAQGAPRGWVLKSVTIAGRDETDTPLELSTSQRVANVAVVFTDQLSEIRGKVADSTGTPITEYTVLAFPVDATLWRPQARQIATTRPDQTGTYQLRGLPPGDYYLTTIDPEQPGEWFEPAFLERQRAGAAQVTLGEADIRTKDFTLTR